MQPVSITSLKRPNSEAGLPLISVGSGTPSASKQIKASVELPDEISPPVEIWLRILKYIRTTPPVPCESLKEVEKVWSMKELWQVAQVSRAARIAVFDILKKPQRFDAFISQIRPNFFSFILSDYLNQALLSNGEFFKLLKGCSPSITLRLESSYPTAKTPFEPIILEEEEEEEVKVNIHAFLVERFIGFSQKIQQGSMSIEELDFLLSKLPDLEGDLGVNNLGPKSQPGYVLSNFALYLDFASPKTFSRLIDFLKEKYAEYEYDPIPQLCKEVVRHRSSERRKILFDVLHGHRLNDNKIVEFEKGYFKGPDGINQKCISVEGVLYTQDGILNGEGVLEDASSAQFVGQFQDGKPFEGRGIVRYFNGWELFEGSLQNGKPEGDVRIWAKTGHLNTFTGRYIDGFPCKGVGAVLDPLGRHFYFSPLSAISGDPAPLNESGWLSIQKITFANGDVYTNPSVDSDLQKVGTTGVYQFKDGSTYTGELKDFKPNGHGVLSYPNGDTCEGTFEDGLFKDRGIFTHANGDKYSGEFSNYKLNGQGVIRYANGNIFDGEFKEGQFQRGRVKITHANGEKYIGEFSNNKPNGQGVITYANGDVFDGEFKEGQFQKGQVNFTYFNVLRYNGAFSNGLPNGQGVLKTQLNSMQGEFENGMINGLGVVIFHDGYVEKGFYSKGSKEGIFNISCPFKESYDVEYKQNKQWNGIFRVYQLDGSVFLQKYIDGQEVPMDKDTTRS